MTQVDYVSAHSAQLGECPTWDPRTGHIYWIDIDGRAVHRLHVSSGGEETITLDARPGSIGMTETPGRFVMAMEHEIGWFAWDDGFAAWGALEEADTGNRLNDGRADPAGRFWVGSMFHIAAENRFTGLLHRVEPDGSHRTVRSDIGVTNGIAFSPDGTTMYFADTLRDTIWAFDYDVASGEARDARVFNDFAELPGRPDGAAVDADGCYWIACVTGGAVARLTPRGDIDRVVSVPFDTPTMPAFGGDGLTTLYVTSIGGGGSHAPDPDQPDAGRLAALDVGVAGRGEALFG